MLWVLLGAIVGKSKVSRSLLAMLGIIPAMLVGRYAMSPSVANQESLVPLTISTKTVSDYGPGRYSTDFVIYAQDGNGLVAQYQFPHDSTLFRISKDGQPHIYKCRTAIYPDLNHLAFGYSFPGTTYVIEYPAGDQPSYLTPNVGDLGVTSVVFNATPASLAATAVASR
jgi:hypothetical protein